MAPVFLSPKLTAEYDDFRAGVALTYHPSAAGICKAIAQALGKEAKIVLYDPEKLGLGKSGKAEGFPFRCICAAAAAAVVCGWWNRPWD